MTLNPSAQPHDVYDVLDGSVSEYFQLVDDCIRPNEEINGQYRMTTTANYSQDCPVQSPSFSHVSFSCNGAQVTDIENSFITAEIDYTFKLNKAVSDTMTPLFIGFKQSLDALERYEILVNSNVLYQQTYVGEESFVLQNCNNDLVRNTHPYTYTSYENAAKMNKNICGIYWKADKVIEANTDITVRIPIKIYLNQFLLLANIKYLPSFCGRWELKLYFNGNNIVILPTEPVTVNDPDSSYFKRYVLDMGYKEVNDGKVALSEPGDDSYITQNFTQIGVNNKFNMIVSSLDQKQSAEPARPECHLFGVAKDVAATLQNCIVRSIRMNVASFLLRSDIYLALKAKYTAKPWIIPANVLQYSRFSGAPHKDNFQCTLSQSVENLDTIFILFPKTPEQHTCFYNPLLTDVKMNVGDFGMVPSTSVSTYDDPRFEAMVLDALNLANSPITSMNKDLARALHSVNYIQKGVSEGGIPQYYTTTELASIGLNSSRGDKSNFILGISLSREGYQNGVSSPNTNVNFIFYGNRELDKTTEYQVAITMMQLVDVALIIQCVPNSDIPIVKLTSKSVC